MDITFVAFSVGILFGIAVCLIIQAVARHQPREQTPDELARRRELKAQKAAARVAAHRPGVWRDSVLDEAIQEVLDH